VKDPGRIQGAQHTAATFTPSGRANGCFRSHPPTSKLRAIIEDSATFRTIFLRISQRLGLYQHDEQQTSCQFSSIEGFTAILFSLFQEPFVANCRPGVGSGYRRSRSDASGQQAAKMARQSDKACRHDQARCRRCKTSRADRDGGNGRLGCRSVEKSDRRWPGAQECVPMVVSRESRHPNSLRSNGKACIKRMSIYPSA
jgi:hypothetical protein